jgi:hypothetical protein
MKSAGHCPYTVYEEGQGAAMRGQGAAFMYEGGRALDLCMKRGRKLL